MPIKGARYRFRKTKAGEQRLAFVKGKVVETKEYTPNKKGKMTPTGPAKMVKK